MFLIGALLAALWVLSLEREAAVDDLYKRSKTLPAEAFCVLTLEDSVIFVLERCK